MSRKRDGLNAAWTAAHPGSGDLVAFAIDDDAMLIWLHDRSATATSFAKAWLLANGGTGNDINGNPKAYTSSGLATVYAGADAANFMHVPVGDARVPDLIGIAQHGVVYTGKQKKIAEHGGNDPQDRWVPLIVSGTPIAGNNGNGIGHGNGGGAAINNSPVETTPHRPSFGSSVSTRAHSKRFRSSTPPRSHSAVETLRMRTARGSSPREAPRGRMRTCDARPVKVGLR